MTTTKLEWHGNKAFWRGRLALAVERAPNGRWYLYRYWIDRYGVASVRSKEPVKNLKDGREYAERLASLWPQTEEHKD
jgi:hypothetical protein